MKLRLYIADTFEVLQNGKVLALGLFPDHVVIVPAPPPIDRPSPDDPVFGLTLSALLAFHEVEGDALKGEALVYAPGIDRPVARMSFDAPCDPDAAAVNLISRFNPLPISSAGVYRLDVDANGQRFSEQFEIRITPPVAATVTPRTTKPARKRSVRKT